MYGPRLNRDIIIKSSTIENWIIALRADVDKKVRQNLDRVIEEMEKELYKKC